MGPPEALHKARLTNWITERWLQPACLLGWPSGMSRRHVGWSRRSVNALCGRNARATVERAFRPVSTFFATLMGSHRLFRRSKEWPIATKGRQGSGVLLEWS